MGEKRDRERAARLAETNGPNTDGAPGPLGTGKRDTGSAERGGAGSHTAAAKRSAKPSNTSPNAPNPKPGTLGQTLDQARVTSDNPTHRILETGGQGSEGSSQDTNGDNGPLSGRERQLAALRPTMFQPGNPGPGKGFRKKLAGDFVRELHRDFNEHGAEAIAKCRTQRPAEYVRIIASLLPKQIDIRESDLADTDDDALESFLALARSALLRGGEAGSGAGAETIEGSARVLPSLPEAI